MNNIKYKVIELQLCKSSNCIKGLKFKASLEENGITAIVIRNHYLNQIINKDYSGSFEDIINSEIKEEEKETIFNELSKQISIIKQTNNLLSKTNIENIEFIGVNN